MAAAQTRLKKMLINSELFELNEPLFSEPTPNRRLSFSGFC